MMDGRTIKIVLSDETKKFIKLQPLKAQQKMTYNIKKVEGGVWIEICSKSWMIPKYGSCALYLTEFVIGYLLFGTMKKELWLITHGIIKKTQKVPDKEIKKAEAIMKEYFYDKK